MNVHLREITKDTLRPVLKLDAGDGGANVASNAVSIAQAHFAPEAWFRAIFDGDTLVGFVMLYDPSLTPEPEDPEFFLWRLMIDKSFQGRGYGHVAVERLIEHVRTRPGAAELYVSHMETAEPLGRFYSSLGFRYTGEKNEGERVMVRKL
jgi:diamine N-acetyltransferase